MELNRIALILNQTKDAYQWVDKLLKGIPHENWDEIPAQIESNISWQVGHLTLSFNFHSIMVITGHQPELYQKFPIREYAQLFFRGKAHACVGKFKPEELLLHLEVVGAKSLEIIAKLTEEDLDAALEPTDFQHPIAKTKFEALDWNVKHTMWHCGQLAMLKRHLATAHDFGKPE